MYYNPFARKGEIRDNLYIISGEIRDNLYTISGEIRGYAIFLPFECVQSRGEIYSVVFLFVCLFVCFSY